MVFATGFFLSTSARYGGLCLWGLVPSSHKFLCKLYSTSPGNKSTRRVFVGLIGPGIENLSPLSKYRGSNFYPRLSMYVTIYVLPMRGTYTCHT